jgi:hypothetical protein
MLQVGPADSLRGRRARGEEPRISGTDRVFWGTEGGRSEENACFGHQQTFLHDAGQ